MAKIKKSIVIENDILGEFISQGEQSLVIVAKNTAALQAMHTASVKVARSFDGTAKSQRELIQNELISQRLVQQKIKNDEQTERLQTQINKTKKLQLQIERDQVREKERLAKAAQKEAKALKESSSEYSKQSKRLNDLRREYKDLILVQGKETAQTRLMRKEIILLDSTLKKVDATVGQHQRSVGNYGKALSGVRNILTGLGIGFGVFSILKDSFNIIKNNDEAMASLSAITGATGQDLEDLKGKIHDLSAEMRVGINETTKLFEIVGSQMPQYLSDAEGLKIISASAITLSRAAKDTIENSTLALTSLLNQFSLGADDAERAMNVLAAGSLVGSVGITQLSESMKNAGSVLSGANVSIEESVALLEVLGKFGVVGAEAGTKLRGSILKLQQAGIGYASGQFEINDALAEAQKKLASYGTELEKDAFLQKTFGAENISTGRILLSNTGLFEQYTAGVTGTNVATEQAAINSDTLAFAFEEIKAAWQNAVIEFSNSTGTMDGLKAVLKFIAANLVSIIKNVLHAASVWVTYRVALALVNKEGTGLFQTLKNMITPIKKTGDAVKDAAANANKARIGFAGWMGIIVALLPYLIDAVKQIGEMIHRTTSLEKVTGKFNERMDEERAKMDLLRVEVAGAIGDKEKMKKLIDEINATYGTTLENIGDETQMMNQLWEAYLKVNAEMEKRIMHQLLEEELTELLKQRRKLERELENAISFGVGFDKESVLGAIDTEIGAVRAELLKLDHGFKNLGAKGTVQTEDPIFDEKERDAANKKMVDAEKEKLDKLNELRRRNADELIMFENEAIKAGYDRQTIDELLLMRKKELIEDELKLIEELNFKTREEYNKTYNERIKLLDSEVTKLEARKVETIKSNAAIVDDEKSKYDSLVKLAVEANEKQVEAQKKAIESLRNSIVKTAELIEEFAELAIDAIDRQIEAIEAQVDASKTREDQLREEAKNGELDAEEAIMVERDRQKALIAEKQELERKKMEIEAKLIMLRAFAAAVEQGQGNPVANIKGQITDLMSFAENLPGFIDGTNTTLGKAMKQNLPGSGTDKFLIKADKDERIINPALSKMIPEHVTNADLVRGYLFNKSAQQIQDSFTNSVSVASSSDRHDSIIYDKMNEQIEVMKNLHKKMPGTSGAFESVVGAFKWREKQDNKSKTIIAPTRKRF